MATLRANGLLAALFSLALATSGSNAAAAVPERPAKTKPAAEQRPRSPEEQRPRTPPDYDGRPPQKARGEGLLWVPRVVLFPFWVVSEFVIRRPLGFVTTEAERANLQNLMLDLFTFGPERNAGIVPTALFDFGFRPSFGLYLFWDDAGAKGHDLRLYAATGGTDWLKASFTDRINLGPRTLLEHQFAALTRPDFLYHGEGWDSREGDRARFTSNRYDAQVALSRQLSAIGWFKGYVGVRRATFESTGCCDDPSIARRVSESAYPLPEGFSEGYSISRAGFGVELDSRTPRPDSGSGLRAVFRGEHAARLAGESARELVRYSGGLGAYWDVTGHNRVLSLSVAALFADPLGPDSQGVPFSELVTLGGDAPLRGFLEGRLRGRSAVAARLRYDWPVWAFLDGALQVEAGNVYGERLEDFAFERSRLSFALGVRSAGRRDHPFELLFGTGTTPLEDGARLDSFRFVIGATNAF